MDRASNARRRPRQLHVHDHGARELHARPQRRVRRRRAERRRGTSRQPRDRHGARGGRRRAGAEDPRGRPDRRHQATAKNVLLKDAPDEPVDGDDADRGHASSTERGPAGGPRAVERATNPNTFAKIVYINKGTRAPLRVCGDTRGRRPDIQAGPTFSPARRARPTCACGTNGDGAYIAEGSLDGEEWLPISAADRRTSATPRRCKFGMKAVRRRGRGERGEVPVLPRRLLGSHRAEDRRRRSSPARARRAARVVQDRADDHARRATTGRRRRSARSSTRIDDGPLADLHGSVHDLGEPGEHEVEYFATDDAAEPNVEPAEHARRARRRRRRRRRSPRWTGRRGRTARCG